MLNLGKTNLTEPITRLVEKVSDAIGGIAAPTQRRRIAKAESDIQLMSAKTQMKIKGIEQRARQRRDAEEIRFQDNIEKIVGGTQPLLSDGSDPNSMGDDWINHFFAKCRYVSDEEMQTLWSKILAGEANTPGSFSRRTLNAVADLEKEEANQFSKLCGYCFYVGVLRIPLVMDIGDEIYTQAGFSFAKLSHLDSIGMIRFDNLAGYQLKQHGPITTRYWDRRLEIVGDGNVDIGKCLLTSVGRELAPICGSEPVEGFLRYMIQKWDKYLNK